MAQASSLFRLLGDDARLRILRLLAAERLNVSELTGILWIAQSGVSRHLGLPQDAGLIAEQREGGYTYFRPAPALLAGEDGSGPLAALLQSEFAAAARTDTGRFERGIHWEGYPEKTIWRGNCKGVRKSFAAKRQSVGS